MPNLFTRDDTFFGVCQGIGDDLGFSPNWLRLGFAPLLFWNPMVAAATYAGLGLVVLAARLLFPAPRVAATQAVIAPVPATARAVEAEPAREERPPLAMAA